MHGAWLFKYYRDSSPDHLTFQGASEDVSPESEGCLSIRDVLVRYKVH